MSEKLKVIFVCLGNICRSPMAECIMRELVAEAGLTDKIEIDSAGTAGYHVGAPPHPGTQAILTEHGIEVVGRSRQITAADMQSSNTWIIAMDSSNKRNLERLNDSHPNLHMLLSFADSPLTPADLAVPDPYYTGDFETVYKLVMAGCQGLLNSLQTSEALP